MMMPTADPATLASFGRSISGSIIRGHPLQEGGGSSRAELQSRRPPRGRMRPRALFAPNPDAGRGERGAPSVNDAVRPPRPIGRRGVWFSRKRPRNTVADWHPQSPTGCRLPGAPVRYCPPEPHCAVGLNDLMTLRGFDANDASAVNGGSSGEGTAAGGAESGAVSDGGAAVALSPALALMIREFAGASAGERVRLASAWGVVPGGAAAAALGVPSGG